jgi:hypothetical protein
MWYYNTLHGKKMVMQLLRGHRKEGPRRETDKGVYHYGE